MLEVLHDCWTAVPWPELGYIGTPAFVLGFLAGALTPNRRRKKR